MSDNFCFEDVTRARLIVENGYKAGAIGYSDMLAINTLIDDFNDYEQAKVEGRMVIVSSKDGLPPTSLADTLTPLIAADSLETVYSYRAKEGTPIVQAALYAASQLRRIDKGELAPVIYAKWAEIEWGAFFRCSNCQHITDYHLTKHCPACGAIMKEKSGDLK